jgi:FlaA1/EpsC-like NDP-sugar epimerase
MTKNPVLESSFIIRHAHQILLTVVALFILAALLLGEVFHMYAAVWWWDDMLHSASGIVLVLIGLLVVYFFNVRHTMALSPLFVALFVFCFALAWGVLWEIFEFVIDIVFHTSMQQWNMPPQAIVMGASYQGMGLRDTMSDLIEATCGAAVTATGVYMAYKYKLSTVLQIMRQAMPWRDAPGQNVATPVKNSK